MTRSTVDCVRRILCIFPRYTPSFGTFEYSYCLTLGTRAFMPPQGLLVIAATLPQHWQVRFIDENMEPATDRDFAWADAVFVSGMHIQRRQIEDICRRAHRHDKVVALGGPSVSACPEHYPSFDYLHVGELGDATDELIAILADSVRRPPRQVVLTTKARRDLVDFPLPAYELARIDRYLLGTIQYSSGCPYRCEFCDIPGLYGRVPRIKKPEQIIAELEKLLACGVTGAVYFVDDNFIANRRAVAELLPHLVAWQQRTGYALNLSCEATLNIARTPEILALMREAGFDTIFCGIETPDPEALKGIEKKQNLVVPILDSVRAINAHGMQVVSGIILGLDTDTPDSGKIILDFIEESKIPMLTINLLEALPRTPLWDRLERDGRINFEEGREFERALPHAVRRGRIHVEILHEGSLRAEAPLRALRIPDACDLAEPAAAPLEQAPRVAAQRFPRPRDARQSVLAARRPRRLPRDVLEIRLTSAAAWRNRTDPCHRRLGASPHHVLPRRLRGAHQRLELRAQIARPRRGGQVLRRSAPEAMASAAF